jgi:hypothetical protein
MGETEINKVTAVKVSRQCPFVLLVKVGSREGKAFGSGVRREVEQGLTAFDRNFEF